MLAMKLVMVSMLVTVLAGISSCARKGMPPIVSDYGDWTNPSGFTRSTVHRGVDIDISYEPVLAAADGVVSYVGRSFGESKLIVITHGQDETDKRIKTGYYHLQTFKVSYGDKVKRGDVIAISGWTGLPGIRGPFPHLHFAVFKTSKYNMLPSVRRGLNPHEFWLDGKPICFDPEKRYSSTPIRFIYPAVCKK